MVDQKVEQNMVARFRRVAIIENPGSGQPSRRRRAALLAALEALHKARIEVQHLTIDGPGSGRELARQAIAAGCEAILVCGGDGTVHEVLQPMVGTQVALGVLPMGTANALASDLGLPRSPRQAVEALLSARPVAVPVGRILLRNQQGIQEERFFTVAAGVGADALLMARMDPVLKRRLGYVLYMIEATRIWMSHAFPFFKATFTNGNDVRTVHASQLLAVRVRSFGGVLGRLAPGASLHGQQLSIVAFRTRSRLRYLRFLLAAMAGRQTFDEGVELISADSIEVQSVDGDTAEVYVEADGESLGQLPVRIEVAQQTLTLLIPPNAQP